MINYSFWTIRRVLLLISLIATVSIMATQGYLGCTYKAIFADASEITATLFNRIVTALSAALAALRNFRCNFQ